MVDLDSAEPTQIELFSMYELAQKLNYEASKLRAWHSDPEIVSPATIFQVRKYRLLDCLIDPRLAELIDAEEQRIAGMQWSKEMLLDILIEKRRGTEESPSEPIIAVAECTHQRCPELRLWNLKGQLTL